MNGHGRPLVAALTLVAVAAVAAAASTSQPASQGAAHVLAVQGAPASTSSNPANGDLSDRPAPQTTASPGANLPATGSDDTFGGKSLPLLLGLVFVSGLALNLTPC